MRILKHIYLDKTFLFFLLIIILTGSFNNFIKYFSLLFIHEMGHTITGLVLGYKLDKISFYPYGGITSFNLPMNVSLKREFLILIMGPVLQIIGYIFLNKIFLNIKTYHYTLLFFNLLPIYPLDGGRIMNVFLGFFLNYMKSLKMTFYISFFMTFLVTIYFIKNFNLNALFTIIMVSIKLIDNYKKRNYYYNRFLLERYLYDFPFCKVKYINNLNNFYRDRLHFIHFKSEKSVLKKYFLQKTCNNFKI